MTVERYILTPFMASPSLDSRQIRIFFSHLALQKRSRDRRQAVTSLRRILVPSGRAPFGADQMERFLWGRE